MKNFFLISLFFFSGNYSQESYLLLDSLNFVSRTCLFSSHWDIRSWHLHLTQEEEFMWSSVNLRVSRETTNNQTCPLPLHHSQLNSDSAIGYSQYKTHKSVTWYKHFLHNPFCLDAVSAQTIFLHFCQLRSTSVVWCNSVC